ncbi:POT family MFS transporter [Archangium lipolyticum]|uniref:POT family MFS transporter n=1 Tax=Archangium lipolyticum TaxID=2970465 RepID=UPI002149FC68|nr:POT family MFS transporter [Archangium lipolyticum]
MESTPTPASRERYPPQIKYIIGNEACERFSFYGMRNILTIFLVQYLLVQHVPDEAARQVEAKAVFHDFVSLVYLFPLLGGWLADRFFGKYRTVLWLSLLYCVGHLLLALFDDHRQGFYAGLFLIALGSGGIKPCVSAFVGDQFTEQNKGLVKGVFALFYWIINFGSFFASLFIPLTLNKLGPAVAFGIPGVLMFIATVIFWLGRGYYTNVPPTGHNPHSFVRVVRDALFPQQKVPGAKSWLEHASSAGHPPEAIEGAKAVFRVMGIFAMIPVFWALFDQKASTWVLQARTMDLTVGSIEIAPSQLQALNPLMVMLLIPLNSFVLFPFLERRGIQITPLRRMGAGMFITSGAYVLVALIQLTLDGGNKISVLWQAAPYLVLTLGEVLVSATGLEFAYSQAPREMKGTLMSLWNITVTIGNQLVSLVARLNVFSGMAATLFFYSGLVFAAAIVFAFIASRYQVRDYFMPGTAAPVPDRTVPSSNPVGGERKAL